jgi:hypothetical protein
VKHYKTREKKYCRDYEVRAIFKSRNTADRFFLFERELHRHPTISEINRIDLVVFFLRAYMGYGRRGIAKHSGLTEYRIRRAYERLKHS